MERIVSLILPTFYVNRSNAHFSFAEWSLCTCSIPHRYKHSYLRERFNRLIIPSVNSTRESRPNADIASFSAKKDK